MIKIGIIGEISKCIDDIHLINALSSYELAGLYDPACMLLNENTDNFLDVKVVDTADELFQVVDAVVFKLNVNHFYLIEKALRYSKHVLIDHLITNFTIEELDYLIKMKNEANVRVKIYNKYLYNPAYLAAKEFLKPPLYIQTRNRIHYSGAHCTGLTVLDRLMHDMFLVCSMIQSGVSKIYTHGISVNETAVDIANVFMEFDNGDIADFILNKTSYKNMYEVSFYQKRSHVNVDLLNKTGWVKTFYDRDDSLQKYHDIMYLKTNNKINNPRIQEFKQFLYAIHASNPLFDLERNRLVLEKSFAIDNKLNRLILV